MLLTDGCPNTVEELRAYESSILDVANTERIDLKTKLALAAEEVSEEVLDFLLDEGRASDPQASVRRQLGTGDIVVTRQLKRWHAVHTIAIVYRDALHNQLNQRYGSQYEDYLTVAREARGKALRFGVGLVASPIPMAAQPLITGTDALGEAAAAYYVRLAWVGGSGQVGQPSEMTAFEAWDGMAIVIDAGSAPANALGFNVYVGLTPTALALQNPAPIGIGLTVGVAASSLAAGEAPGNGQAPETYVTGARVLRRG